MLNSFLYTLGTALGVVAGITLSGNHFEFNQTIVIELALSMVCFYASNKVKS